MPVRPWHSERFMLVRKLQPLRRLRAVRCVYLGSAVAGSCRDETWSLAGRGPLLSPGQHARWSDMWVSVILVRPASASLLGQVALVVLGFAASGLDPLRVGCFASSLGVRSAPCVFGAGCAFVGLGCAGCSSEVSFGAGTPRSRALPGFACVVCIGCLHRVLGSCRFPSRG